MALEMLFYVWSICTKPCDPIRPEYLSETIIPPGIGKRIKDKRRIRCAVTWIMMQTRCLANTGGVRAKTLMI